MSAAWVALAAIAVLAALGLAAPLWRSGRKGDGRDVEIALYRDQLAEVERDRAAGLVGEREAVAARLEVERRLLKAARRVETAAAERPTGRRLALASALLVPLAALGLYGVLGAPGTPDQPLAARAVADRSPELEQIRAMVAGLEQRLAADGSDVEGWVMLGRSRLVLGDAPAAVEAYREARRRDPAHPGIDATLAESLIAAAGGVVTPEARELLGSPATAGDPRAPFYLGLAELQAGDAHAAIVAWRRLLAESPAEAPWRPRVENAIRQAARELGVDGEALLADVPGQRPEEQLSFEQIRPLVRRLELHLETTGGDAEGWRRLGDARRLLGEAEAARDAYGRALALIGPDHPDYPAIRALLDTPGG